MINNEMEKLTSGNVSIFNHSSGAAEQSKVGSFLVFLLHFLLLLRDLEINLYELWIAF